MMFSQFKYLYCILFIVLQYTVHKSIAISTSDKVTRVLNILHQISWHSYDKPEKGIADQKIFVNETCGKFIDIIRIPSKIYSNNLDIFTSTMYVALGCKCGETIIDTFTLFIKWMDYEQEVHGLMVSTLKKFNETVLKTISVLFDFIDIAPNVLYFEPGILKTAMMINFHLNYLFETCKVEDYCQLEPKELMRVIFQMINLLERYTISYCSSGSNKPDPMDYTNCSINTLVSPQHHLKTQHIINYFKNLLDNSGLSISNFYKYNITNNTSKDMALDEDSLKFNIIVYVLNNFNSLLGNQQIFLKSPEMDIVNIFVDQKSMFDLIMLIFHSNTRTFLVDQKRYQNKKLKSTFLIKSNIRDNLQLIEYYKELQIESNLKKFPTDFINQIKLFLRILKTIHYSHKILDIDILIKNEKKQIDLLTDRLRTNIELDDDFIKNLTYHVNNDSPLQTFLKNVVSMKYVVYFNQIYNLLQNDVIKPNKEIHKNLNTIRHFIKPQSVNYECQLLKSAYAFSFDLLSSVNNDPPITDIKSLKNGFNSILIVLRTLRSLEIKYLPNTVPLSYIVIYADQYLSYNLIKYPQNLPQEKLNRILYLLTNFIDRHHVLNCSPFNYRDLIFDKFENDSTMVKQLINLKNNPWAGDLSKTRKEFVNNETTTQTQLENFVLFDSFLNKINFEETQLKLYWNGKLKSIHDIRGYMNENLFNFISIPNYTKSFFEWIAALFSYNVLDTMNSMLIDSSDSRYIEAYYRQFTFYEYVFKQIFYNDSNAHEFVFNSIRDLHFTSDELKSHTFKFKIFGLKIILESYLKHYTNKFRVVDKPQEQPNIARRPSKTLDEFTKIFDTLETVLKIIPTDDCKSRMILNPLIYVFSDYFDIHRTYYEIS